MGYILLHVLITFFSVVGFMEVMHMLITLPFKNNKSRSVLILFPESDRIEYELRSYTSKMRWPENMQPQKIYCISDNLTQEAKEICRLFCKEYEFIEVTDSSQLRDLKYEI